MKVICALCLILLASACTKNSHVTRESVGTLVQDVSMEVYHLKEVEWFVGKRKERKVTQSITFFVGMPKIDGDDLDFLIQNKSVDAWILRLIARKAGKEQDLGSLHTLFRPPTKGRGSSVGPAASVTIKLYYAAAYASERFRTMRCPAFSHNKKIDRMTINGENTPFEIAIQSATPYQERSQLVALTPSSFNGGNSLVGEYFVEIAPYNSSKRAIYAPFRRLPMSVEVKSEESISIESCAGEHPEMTL